MRTPAFREAIKRQWCLVAADFDRRFRGSSPSSITAAGRYATLRPDAHTCVRTPTFGGTLVRRYDLGKATPHARSSNREAGRRHFLFAGKMTERTRSPQRDSPSGKIRALFIMRWGPVSSSSRDAASVRSASSLPRGEDDRTKGRWQGGQE